MHPAHTDPQADTPPPPDAAVTPPSHENTSGSVPEEDPLPNGSFYHRPRFRQDFPYPLLVSLLYLGLGFFFQLWHPGWIIFLTIPLFYLPDSERDYLRLLCNPVMVTIIYLLLGVYCNLWHPGWVIFLALPLLRHFDRRPRE